MNNNNNTNPSKEPLKNKKEPIPKTAQVMAITPEIQVINDFNKVYTTLVHSGKNYVLRLNTDAFGHSFLEFFSQKEFIDAHRDAPKIQVIVNATNGPVVKELNPAKIWIESPDSSSSKHGITFYPKKTKFHKGKFNAYMGRGCEPVQSTKDDVSTYLKHVFNVICNGDKKSYEYVIKWLAHLFQKPQEKPEVAIVLKAGQGTGKGTFVDPIGKIIGAHYLYAQSPEQVIGKFNAQLENKLLVFADEFFAGSKGSTDRLKTMITEKVGSIERKGQDRISVPCFARIIMATNHENVIKIERDERRYLYLEVSDKHKQDSDYFRQLHQLLAESDFASKLLNYLLKLDISDFEPRQVPKTKELTAQKIDNLEPLDKWAYTFLKHGEIAGAWPTRLPASKMISHAEEWLESNALTKFVWGDLPTKAGKLLSQLGLKKFKPGAKNGEKRVGWYDIPTLEVMRENFNEHINADLDWE
jgi:putative DNA primase/helicase